MAQVFQPNWFQRQFTPAGMNYKWEARPDQGGGEFTGYIPDVYEGDIQDLALTEMPASDFRNPLVGATQTPSKAEVPSGPIGVAMSDNRTTAPTVHQTLGPGPNWATQQPNAVAPSVVSASKTSTPEQTRATVPMVQNPNAIEFIRKTITPDSQENIDMINAIWEKAERAGTYIPEAFWDVYFAQGEKYGDQILRLLDDPGGLWKELKENLEQNPGAVNIRDNKNFINQAFEKHILNYDDRANYMTGVEPTYYDPQAHLRTHQLGPASGAWRAQHGEGNVSGGPRDPNPLGDTEFSWRQRQPVGGLSAAFGNVEEDVMARIADERQDRIETRSSGYPRYDYAAERDALDTYAGNFTGGPTTPALEDQWSKNQAELAKQRNAELKKDDPTIVDTIAQGAGVIGGGSVAWLASEGLARSELANSRKLNREASQLAVQLKEDIKDGKIAEGSEGHRQAQNKINKKIEAAKAPRRRAYKQMGETVRNRWRKLARPWKVRLETATRKGRGAKGKIGMILGSMAGIFGAGGASADDAAKELGFDTEILNQVLTPDEVTQLLLMAGEEAPEDSAAYEFFVKATSDQTLNRILSAIDPYADLGDRGHTKKYQAPAVGGRLGTPGLDMWWDAPRTTAQNLHRTHGYWNNPEWTGR